MAQLAIPELGLRHELGHELTRTVRPDLLHAVRLARRIIGIDAVLAAGLLFLAVSAFKKCKKA